MRSQVASGQSAPQEVAALLTGSVRGDLSERCGSVVRTNSIQQQGADVNGISFKIKAQPSVMSKKDQTDHTADRLEAPPLVTKKHV